MDTNPDFRSPLRKLGRPIVDISGMRFGKLVVIDIADHSRSGILWRCLCDCGREHVVLGCSLRSSHTKSCGCAGAMSRAVCSREELLELYEAHGSYSAVARSLGISYQAVQWRLQAMRKRGDGRSIAVTSDRKEIE